MDVKVRPGNKDDNNFIYATWLRGLYYGSEFYGSIQKDVFFKKYEQVIQALLAKPNVLVSIACLDDAEGSILAYAVYEPTGTLHYAFTKEPWRRQGLVQKAIVGCSEISSVTHLTKLGNSIRLKKGWLFNPWLI